MEGTSHCTTFPQHAERHFLLAGHRSVALQGDLLNMQSACQLTSEPARVPGPPPGRAEAKRSYSTPLRSLAVVWPLADMTRQRRPSGRGITNLRVMLAAPDGGHTHATPAHKIGHGKGCHHRYPMPYEIGRCVLSCSQDSSVADHKRALMSSLSTETELLP